MIDKYKQQQFLKSQKVKSMKNLFSVFGAAIFSLLLMTSCSKEEVWTDSENFVFNTYKEMRQGPLGGHGACYTVVFPVTIVFPDGNEVAVEDRAELVTTIRDWKDNNPEAEERPTIAFPIQVEDQDGNIIDVESHEDLQKLRRECRAEKHEGRKCKNFAQFLNNPCFKVEFPISIVLEDGNLVELKNRGEVARLLRSWKNDRPEERPELVFPLTITLKKGNTEVEVGSIEEFEAIIAECRG